MSMDDPFYRDLELGVPFRVEKISFGAFTIELNESVLMPPDEIRFYDGAGKLIGKIVNIALSASPPPAKEKP